MGEPCRQLAEQRATSAKAQTQDVLGIGRSLGAGAGKAGVSKE